jgi:aspartyl-tRNA(Asn)/glutamyl-tRNA(Gln) amidotransferase subunit B
LPLVRKQRLIKDFGLPASDAEVFKSNVALGNYFEGIAKQAKNPKAIANWIINNLQALMGFQAVQKAYPLGELPAEMAVPRIPLNELLFPANYINELVELVDSGKINSKIAQEVFKDMYFTGKSPAAIVQEKGLAQVSDTGAIEKFCDDVIAANPGPANDFKSGKTAALNFLKGQVMKLSKGKANPGVVGEILERKLKS